MIEPRIDAKRGCGYRKPGGLYLVGGSSGAPCGRLPIPIDLCPTCGHGIKPSRGWTWIDSDPVLSHHRQECASPICASCPLCPTRLKTLGRVGLLWVGQQYYSTPQKFSREAERLGISRRIAEVPRKFIIGETWVWLAHRKGVPRRCDWCRPSGDGSIADSAKSAKCSHCDGTGITWIAGIFEVFRPSGIEYVARGDESAEEIESLRKRGITPVSVTRQEDSQSAMFEV